MTATAFDDAAQREHAAVLGLWIFLISELMFFGPLFLGYVYGRVQWSAGFAAASRATDIELGSINTAILLTSSFTMAAAIALRELAPRMARALLLATATCGAVFLAIKGIEYHDDWRRHLFPAHAFYFDAAHAQAAQYFFWIYFAVTALHALHLLIGIGVVSALATRAQQANAPRWELTGLYWHFVDCVWIFLYPMLYLVGTR
ncbi:MAG TPA: cytochrome c oxidase subunit 3 [Spongiibacteraceae bacterium]